MKEYIRTVWVNAEKVWQIKTRGSKSPNYIPWGEDRDADKHMPPDATAEVGYMVEVCPGVVDFVTAEAFEQVYRPAEGMPFGDAIEAAKAGRKIARAGWNGKGMWVVYRTGYPDGIPCNKNTADAVGIPEGTLFKVRPYLQMKCVDDSFQMWLASQSDILADDWYIVE